MPTLVLSPRYTSDSRTLRAAAVRAGWGVQRLGGWRAPGRLRGAEPVVYGEPLFAEVIAAQLGLALIDAPHGWLPDLPERHRRRRIEPATLGAARAAVAAGPAFVKPADGRKGFEGAVYRGGGLPETLPDDTAVFIAEPVTWEVEFRCFVAGGEVTTMSPYWRDGALAMADDGDWPASADELAAVAAYAERVLGEVPVPPAFVLDVGRIRDRGWAVVEANSAWGAGVYGCDPAAVLAVLRRSCVPRNALSSADAGWAAEPVEIER